MSSARTHQQNAVVEIGGSGQVVARVSQLDVVLQTGRVSKRGRVGQQDVVALTGGAENRSVARVHQLDVVMVVAEGSIPENALEVRAFDYDIDGHLFYGLHITEQGTFLYDTTTGQWCKWASGTLPLWNAQYHVRWGVKDDYYAASLIDNAVVRIAPDSVLDDSFRTNTFQATGRLEYQERQYIKNPEAHLFGSVGLRGGVIKVRYSNNDGETWSADKTRTMAVGVRAENVLFRNLGSVRAPGRLYQIEDEGSLRRIQSLNVQLGNRGEGDD